ncbi:MAG TPA: tRNA lysidine(34) synthetase TilS [Candidatus Binataceae bacterium]|nr:tRNA lysidine(34) synthetase TilS [Candidatus Binataceae bacterium]
MRDESKSPARASVPRAISRALARARVGADALLLGALSGGADSVAMLHALVELRPAFGYRLAAAHLNHGLRGAESDRDEAFVRELCARLRIDLVVERAAGLDAAMPNLEEAARDARHAFLRSAAAHLGASHIALGHHRDDRAETVLMRMLRGAGIAGLGAMEEAGPHGILRPMLSVSREEIRAYLRALGAEFVEDGSNASSAMLRNRIRHELLPALERDYVPGAGARLAALAGEMRTLDAYVTREAAREFDAMRTGAGGLDLARFAALDPALRAPVLRAFVADRAGSLRRITRAHLDAVVNLIIEGPPSGEISLPGRWRGVRIGPELRLDRTAPQSVAPFTVQLPVRGTTVVEAADCVFETELMPARQASTPEDKNSAVFDILELGAGRLLVRNFVPGDRVRPLGMDGTRKVKEVLIDAKIAREHRRRVPLVVNEAENEVLWIPGLVRSRRGLLTASSQLALRISARELSSNRDS